MTHINPIHNNEEIIEELMAYLGKEVLPNLSIAENKALDMMCHVSPESGISMVNICGFIGDNGSAIVRSLINKKLVYECEYGLIHMDEMLSDAYYEVDRVYDKSNANNIFRCCCDLTYLDCKVISFEEIDQRTIAQCKFLLDKRQRTAKGDKRVIGDCCAKIGNKYKEEEPEMAIAYLQKAIDCYIKSDPCDVTHIDKDAFISLAECYIDIKNYEAAEAIYNNAVEYLSAALGPNHLFVADIYSCLSSMYEKIEMTNSMLDSALKKIRIKEEGFRREYTKSNNNESVLFYLGTDLIWDYHNFANSYERLDKFDECLRYRERAIAIARVIYADDLHCKEVAYLTLAIGVTYSLAEKFEIALEYMLKALPDMEDAYKNLPGHEDMILLYENLDYVYHKLEMNQESYDYATKALNYEIIAYDGDQFNEDVAQKYDNLALSCNMLGMHQEELECYQRSLCIRDKLYADEPNEDLVKSYFWVGEAFARLNEKESALEYFRNALDIARTFLSDEEDADETIRPILDAIEELGGDSNQQ